jgi:hypothetical protein
MKNIKLIHTHFFEDHISLEELNDVYSSWDFNHIFLKNPICYKIDKPVAGKIEFIIPEGAIYEKDLKNIYKGNHIFPYTTSNSFYSIINSGIVNLKKHFNFKEIFPFTTIFVRGGALERIEFYSDHSIKIYLFDDAPSFSPIGLETLNNPFCKIGYSKISKISQEFKLNKLLKKIFKFPSQVLNVYGTDSAIISVKCDSKQSFLSNISIAKKLGLNISKIGKNRNGFQEFLVIDNHGTNFKSLNLYEDALSFLDIEPMDIFSVLNDDEQNIFHEINRKIKPMPFGLVNHTEFDNFDKELLKHYETLFPIQFNGIAQISYLDPYDDEAYFEEVFNDQEQFFHIHSAKNLKDILYKTLEQAFDDEDYYLEISSHLIVGVKYESNGKLIIFIKDFSDNLYSNKTLLNAFVDNGYEITDLSVEYDSIKMETNNFAVKIQLAINPSTILVQFFPKTEINEGSLKAEVVKFTEVLNADLWNFTPVRYNKEYYALISFWHDDFHDQHLKLSFDNELLLMWAEAVKILSTNRKSLSYKIQNEDPIDKLVFEINKKEKLFLGKNIEIEKTNLESNLRMLNEFPNGINKHRYQVFNLFNWSNRQNSGDILIWSYHEVEGAVSLEYTIQKLTNKQIVDLPFTKLVKKNSKYKITVVEYPCTFSFPLTKAFKPYSDDNPDDDGRAQILLKKMYQLNVPSSCHAYEDYVIEHVQQHTHSEYWYLGS